MYFYNQPSYTYTALCKVTVCDTNIIQHEAHKQQVDKCRLPGTYWATSNPPNQGKKQKYGGNGHHKDQDAPISSVNYIWDLQVEGPDVWKIKTRRVPSDDEGLQDRHWRNGNYFCDWKNQFLRTMIRGGALREFDVIAGQVGSTNNTHLKKIKKGLLSYSPPLNALNKQKRAMWRAMRKTWDIQLKIFAARLTELNNCLPPFLGLRNAKNMGPEELNEILLHAVPNSWVWQAYLQGWYFEERTYKYTCDMFELMEIVEAIYEGGAPSKNDQQAEANRSSSGRKKNGGASASPSNPNQGRAGKCKRSNEVHSSDEPTREKKTFLLHGPGHS